MPFWILKSRESFSRRGLRRRWLFSFFSSSESFSVVLFSERKREREKKKEDNNNADNCNRRKKKRNKRKTNRSPKMVNVAAGLRDPIGRSCRPSSVREVSREPPIFFCLSVFDCKRRTALQLSSPTGAASVKAPEDADGSGWRTRKRRAETNKFRVMAAVLDGVALTVAAVQLRPPYVFTERTSSAANERRCVRYATAIEWTRPKRPLTSRRDEQ